MSQISSENRWEKSVYVCAYEQIKKIQVSELWWKLSSRGYVWRKCLGMVQTNRPPSGGPKWAVFREFTFFKLSTPISFEYFVLNISSRKLKKDFGNCSKNCSTIQVLQNAISETLSNLKHLKISENSALVRPQPPTAKTLHPITALRRPDLILHKSTWYISIKF